MVRRAYRQARNALTRALLNRVRSLKADPILITGLQKSGTSAIAALLAHATGASVTIDVFCKMNRIEFELLDSQLSFSEFVRRAKCYFASDIVKEPEFVLFMPELLEQFPKSKHVFIVREPFDNIRSILNRLGVRGDLASVPQQAMNRIKQEAPLWAPLLDGKYEKKFDNYVSNLAYRWSCAAGGYFERQSDVTLVRYEDFMADKAKCICELARQLGMDPVVSIAAVENKQFQPAGVKADPLEFFGAANAERIAGMCEGLSARLGYSDSGLTLPSNQSGATS